jgi:hypothetical protein
MRCVSGPLPELEGSELSLARIALAATCWETETIVASKASFLWNSQHAVGEHVKDVTGGHQGAVLLDSTLVERSRRDDLSILQKHRRCVHRQKETMNRSHYATTISSHWSLVAVEIEYPQLSKDGAPFGSIVPYGQPWLTYGNGRTSIFTNRTLRFESGTLPHGKYAIYTVPWQDRWMIVFYTETNDYGLPKRWDNDAVALTVTVPIRRAERVAETFRVAIEQTSHFEASLEIAWDRTRVSVPFEIPSQRDALKAAATRSGRFSFDEYFVAAMSHYESETS